jgi:E3 ubiquitin-protein ligase RBBP6
MLLPSITRSFSTITFDGHFVSVGEARKLIALKQSLAPEAAEELVLSNPKTGQEYRDDTEQLPKGTSVIVRRVPGGVRLRPLVGATPVPGGPSGAAQATSSAPQQQPVASGGDAAQPGAAADEFGADPFVAAALKAQQEAAQAAAAAAAAATRQEAASARGGFGGRGPGGRGGRGSRMPHPTYVCPRCNLIGKHWVSDCPTQGDPAYDVRSVREPRGIPQGKVVKNTEGSMLLPGGVLGELVTNTHAYEQTVAHMMGKVQEQEADQGQKQQGQVLAIEAPPAKQPDQPKPATQQASTAPAAVQEKPQQPQQQQGSDGAAPDHKSPDAAPTEASAPGLFDDDDDVLNAAAQPLKLSAPVPAAGSEAVSKGGPITKSGGSPPPVAQPADVDAALIQYEREALPEDLRRPFCTPKEFLDHLPLLVEILPAAAPRMLLKAFGAGLPLTRTEFEQLKQQEATAALAAKTAAAEAAAAAQAPAANGKHGSSKGGSKGDEDRSKRSSAKRRSRSRSRSRDRSSRRSRRDTSPSRHHHHSDSSRHHRDGSRDGRDRGADKEVRASGSSRRAPSKLNPEHGTAGSNHQNAAQQVRARHLSDVEVPRA